MPTFAAERQRLQHGARSVPAAIDRYLRPTGLSTANPPAAVAAVDRWDRQTEGRTQPLHKSRSAICTRLEHLIWQIKQTADEQRDMRCVS